MNTCTVCGSTAESTRGRLHLCRAHVAVCDLHLLDPCPKCDAAVDELLGWARLFANGNRHHAIVHLEPYDHRTACGIVTAWPVSLRTDDDLDEYADAPNPPKRCPACVKALAQ